MTRVCILCPHHISAQPRSLREADTLHQAGYQVRVVSRTLTPEGAAADRTLMARRGWRLDAVELRRGSAPREWLAAHLISRAAGGVGRVAPFPALAARALVPGVGAVIRRAAAAPADLYIGHTQVMLRPAAVAAARAGARYAFDCEDLLDRSGTDDGAAVRRVEAAHVPGAAFVTAASAPMAAALERSTGRSDIAVLHNVPPLSSRGEITPPSTTGGRRPLRLHWFSQTIGPGRGIEDAVRSLPDLNGVELHLRGRIPQDYRSRLLSLADRAADRLYFLPLAPHDSLIPSMSGFDVGLALERPAHPNYALTITNKVFAYLMAGLAVLATDTPGQRAVLEGTGGAALYPAADLVKFCDVVRSWRDDADRLWRDRRSAWKLASDRFNWDTESGRYLELVQRACAPC